MSSWRVAQAAVAQRELEEAIEAEYTAAQEMAEADAAQEAALVCKYCCINRPLITMHD